MTRAIEASSLRFLQLLQLADSALPVGTLAHSFGLEFLVAANDLDAASCAGLLAGMLEESWLLEAVFCRAAWHSALDHAALAHLNDLFSARKPARESRQASLALGRRFVQLAAALIESPPALDPLASHYAVAFGAVSAAARFPVERAVLAFLEQCCATALSALQRLLPLGQHCASVILWELKPAIVRTSQRSRKWRPANAPCFNPALEIASMRHPLLETRLFLS